MEKQIFQIKNRPADYHMVGDGFRVYNYFPSGFSDHNRISPFLMLDFNPAYDFGPTGKPRGVDVHPHKGFETVTIAYKGSVAHHDSRGNSGVIHPGDVQWMTAGAGILHKEYHESEFAAKGGPFEMVQLWVNLPAKDKRAPPHYQALTHEGMKRVELADNGGTVKVIAGDFQGIKGSATTFTDINLFDIRLNQGGEMKTDIPESHNLLLLIIEGDVTVNGQHASQHQFVIFEHRGTGVAIKANENSIVLLMSGEPIREPVAQYGPFVMNTHAELQEAFREFQEGKFGVLE